MRQFAPLLAIIAIICATPAFAFVGNAPSLNASILNYEPVPATPGSLLDVYIQISNTGTAASDVAVRFNDNAPFSIETESDRVKLVESLPGQQSFLLKYKVRVGADATPGTNYIKLTWRVGDTDNEQSALLPLEITGNTVELTVEDVVLEPETFVPGSDGKISITLHNNAQLRINAGTLKLDLGSVDLVPIGGTNSQRFTDLPPGGQRTFSFTLVPTPSITPGVYKLPVQVNFTDQTGAQYSQQEYIGVRIGSKPDVSVTIDDSKITDLNAAADVIIRVTNKGLGEVKFVDVTLGNSSSYEIGVGSPERYVGNIDSDDYKTARVSIIAKDRTVAIPVTVSYMDALNTRYTSTSTLTIPVRGADSGGGSTYMIIGIIVVVVIIGWLVWRSRKKR